MLGGSGQPAGAPGARELRAAGRYRLRPIPRKPTFHIHACPFCAHHPDLAPGGVRGHMGMFWLPRSCNPFLGLDKADWLSGSRAIREVNEGYREMPGHGAEAECVPGHQGPRWSQGLEESSEASGGWRHVPVPRGGDWAWGASWPRASRPRSREDSWGEWFHLKCAWFSSYSFPLP